MWNPCRKGSGQRRFRTLLCGRVLPTMRRGDFGCFRSRAVINGYRRDGVLFDDVSWTCPLMSNRRSIRARSIFVPSTRRPPRFRVHPPAGPNGTKPEPVPTAVITPRVGWLHYRYACLRASQPLSEALIFWRMDRGWEVRSGEVVTRAPTSRSFKTRISRFTDSGGAGVRQATGNFK